MIRAWFPLLAVCALPLSASLSVPKDPPPQVRYASLPEGSSPGEAPSAVAAAAAANPSGREAILDLARKGLLDSARAMALKSLAAHPDDAFLLLLIGKLSPAGQESADYLQKAIKAGGSSAEAEEALFRLGQYTYATGKYYLAIPYFRDYLRRYPQGGWRDPATYWMGNACLALVRSRADKASYLDSGETWFAKLLEETKPGDYYRPLALEGLAKAKAGKGDREGAWQATMQAMDKAPDEERPSLLLLGAQTRQGVDRGAEKSLLSQLIAKYPQSPEARYLRKLNAGADTARWRSGSGFSRTPVPTSTRDSLAAAGAIPDNAKEAPAPVSEAEHATVSPAPSAPPAHPSASAPSGKPYTLQCGAFTQASNAQAMMATLSKLGLTPETLERERGGKRIYQVWVGRFATPEEAEAFARDHLKPERILSEAIPVNP
ncbi:MAG: SPOR domain-containing protein [Fibrobacteres bacterium]|nr:SPOR domain-containing protein [Fibrobacterota bacterium]